MREFTIHDDQCAMKVGTDALILGAAAQVNPGEGVLDIGTGSGIVLMMVGQRCGPHPNLTGIELSPAAWAQAKENVTAHYPKAQVIHADALKWLDEAAAAGKSWECVVSNPPYFRDKPLGPDEARNLARHDFALPIELLLQKVSRVLANSGRVTLVWPTDRMDDLDSAAFAAELCISSLTEVRSFPSADCIRSLVELVHRGQASTGKTRTSELVIEKARRAHGGPPLYSHQYKQLLSAFVPSFDGDTG